MLPFVGVLIRIILLYHVVSSQSLRKSNLFWWPVAVHPAFSIPSLTFRIGTALRVWVRHSPHRLGTMWDSLAASIRPSAGPEPMRPTGSWCSVEMGMEWWEGLRMFFQVSFSLVTYQNARYPEKNLLSFFSPVGCCLMASSCYLRPPFSEYDPHGMVSNERKCPNFCHGFKRGVW